MKKELTNPTNFLITKKIWKRMCKLSAIKQWTIDLARISKDSNLNDLKIVGRAVLLQHDDLDLVEQYIKFVANHTGVNFCIVKTNEILELDDWFGSINKEKLTLVYLEPGAWMAKGLSEMEGNEWTLTSEFNEFKAAAFRKKLSDLLYDYERNKKIIFVTGVQSTNQFDINLRKAGLFDRRIIISELDYETQASIFFDKMGSVNFDVEIITNHKRLGCLLHHEFPRIRQKELFFKAIKRLAWQRNEKINYKDIVEFAVYGLCEVDFVVDLPEIRYRHAVHEAGHALLIHLDSREKLPPEYCSVLKRGNSLGIVVRRFEDHERTSDDLSYCDLVHQIRVSLAGRAAEYLLLGASEVSANGSTGDLEKASYLASNLFGRQGHSPVLSSDSYISSNLAVCAGLPSSSECQHVESMTRNFLGVQFQLVLEILRKNKNYLEMITKTLNEQIILMREDFTSIYAHSQTITNLPSIDEVSTKLVKQKNQPELNNSQHDFSPHALSVFENQSNICSS